MWSLPTFLLNEPHHIETIQLGKEDPEELDKISSQSKNNLHLYCTNFYTHLRNKPFEILFPYENVS